MNYRTGPLFSRQPTARPLKLLILITIATSLIGAFSPHFRELFSLSLEGIRHLHLWQFFTYLFISPTPGGITFSFLLQLSFNMYLLWIFGSSLLLRSHPTRFFILYFGSGIFGAALTFALASLFSLPLFLSGSTSALYAVLAAWIMANQEAQLLLFFAIPIKARHLLILLIGMNLLIDFSQGDWIHSTSFIGSLAFGYLFALISAREQGPFSFLHPFERLVLRTLEQLSHFGKNRAKKLYKSSKIYDIHSGQPLLNDDAFMDAMLSRISLYGEASLTPEEKKRMREISGKKNSKK